MDSIKKYSDDWQKRLIALQEIQKQFQSIENTTITVPVDTWRVLKPLKDMIQDLRSQIVKEVARDSMSPLVRDLLPVLVEVRGGGNKVCGAYCGECVEVLVSTVVTKGPTLRYLVDAVVESKNKGIRACCIGALTLVLVHWSTVLDKSDVQQIEVGMKSALYDASSTCRSASLTFFQRFQQKFSKRAALLLTTVDFKVQRRLESLPLLQDNATTTTPQAFLPRSNIFLTKRHVSFDQVDDKADDGYAIQEEGDGDESSGVRCEEAEAEDDTLVAGPREDDDEPPLKKLLDSMLDAQRGFLDFMFLNLNVEMDHLDVFQKSAAIASSADAIAYCDQVRNICQEKIDAVSAFMEKIVEAQQKAMET
ncbi:hypothetical protein DYB32_003774 [Aphanomyces invadans]|uniref:CLASP N-terminal domain-containing protein n=1 Tax=Aphanomyces invadans TaxID=157072 RepID=A0A3R6VCM1_9STRA|nr:hypothetical protein DYB32_003774 [Aphanomyces invadans]